MLESGPEVEFVPFGRGYAPTPAVMTVSSHHGQIVQRTVGRWQDELARLRLLGNRVSAERYVAPELYGRRCRVERTARL